MTSKSATHRNRRTSMPNEPILAAIERFWNAREAERKAARRVHVLKSRLPDEVTRGPRVQIGRLVGTLDQPDQPIYANCVGQINHMHDRHRAPQLAMFGRGAVEAKRTYLLECRRARAAKRKEFEADRRRLEAEQKRCGLWQARADLKTCEDRLLNLQCAIAWKLKPASLEGAVALLQFVGRYYRSTLSNNDEPGLSASQTASLTKRAAAFWSNLRLGTGGAP